MSQKAFWDIFTVISLNAMANPDKTVISPLEEEGKWMKKLIRYIVKYS